MSTQLVTYLVPFQAVIFVFLPPLVSGGRGRERQWWPLLWGSRFGREGAWCWSGDSQPATWRRSPSRNVLGDAPCTLNPAVASPCTSQQDAQSRSNLLGCQCRRILMEALRALGQWDAFENTTVCVRVFFPDLGRNPGAFPWRGRLSGWIQPFLENFSCGLNSLCNCDGNVDPRAGEQPTVPYFARTPKDKGAVLMKDVPRVLCYMRDPGIINTWFFISTWFFSNGFHYITLKILGFAGCVHRRDGWKGQLRLQEQIPQRHLRRPAIFPISELLCPIIYDGACLAASSVRDCRWASFEASLYRHRCSIIKCVARSSLKSNWG